MPYSSLATVGQKCEACNGTGMIMVTDGGPVIEVSDSDGDDGSDDGTDGPASSGSHPGTINLPGQPSASTTTTSAATVASAASAATFNSAATAIALTPVASTSAASAAPANTAPVAARKVKKLESWVGRDPPTPENADFTKANSKCLAFNVLTGL